jgi:hypothetical protein
MVSAAEPERSSNKQDTKAIASNCVLTVTVTSNTMAADIICTFSQASTQVKRGLQEADASLSVRRSASQVGYGLNFL